MFSPVKLFDLSDVELSRSQSRNKSVNVKCRPSSQGLHHHHHHHPHHPPPPPPSSSSDQQYCTTRRTDSFLLGAAFLTNTFRSYVDVCLFAADWGEEFTLCHDIKCLQTQRKTSPCRRPPPSNRESDIALSKRPERNQPINTNVLRFDYAEKQFLTFYSSVSFWPCWEAFKNRDTNEEEAMDRKPVVDADRKMSDLFKDLWPEDLWLGASI